MNGKKSGSSNADCYIVDSFRIILLIYLKSYIFNNKKHRKLIRLKDHNCI